jgi:C4-dicarboxylate-specific signal transduction histidine kinase
MKRASLSSWADRILVGEVQIQQVPVNLLRNAIQAMESVEVN